MKSICDRFVRGSFETLCIEYGLTEPIADHAIDMFVPKNLQYIIDTVRVEIVIKDILARTKDDDRTE